MTKFLVRNSRTDKFHVVTRKRYKMIARECNDHGTQIRVETMYVDGEPQKHLTLLGDS